MIRSLVRSALLLGFVFSTGGSTAGQVDDTESLVQRATAVIEKPKLKVKQSKEDKEAEPETRRRLHEQVAGFLQQVPGLPLFVSGTAKNFVVPQIMEFRRKADSATRKLLDGIVAMDMGHKNLADPGVLSETLHQLSELYEQVGNHYVASLLRNESILLPPFLATAPKLLAMQQTTSMAVLNKLQPLLEQFVREIGPIIKDSGSKVEGIIKQTLFDIAPHAKKAREQARQAIGGTLQSANTELQRDESFGELKKAVKLVVAGENA